MRFRSSTGGRRAQKREDVTKARTRAGNKKDKLFKKFDRIANAMENGVVLSILRGLATFKKRIDVDEIEKLFTEGRYEEAVEIIPWDKMPEDMDRLRESLEPVTMAGGKFAVDALPAPAKALRIAPENPRLRRYIDSQIGNMVVDIGVESKKTIQFAVSESFRQGLNPKRAARIIRDSVGITEKQQMMIMRVRQRELAERSRLVERMERLRSEGKHLSKTGRKIDLRLKTLTDFQIDRRVQKKTEAAQKNRSIAIARTEITDAMNEGQEIIWDEAAQEGLIDRTTAKKSWVTVPDADRSKVCSQMSGQKVGMDEEFWSEVLGQSFRHPPSHPNCRSAVILDP